MIVCCINVKINPTYFSLQEPKKEAKTEEKKKAEEESEEEESEEDDDDDDEEDEDDGEDDESESDDDDDDFSAIERARNRLAVSIADLCLFVCLFEHFL